MRFVRAGEVGRDKVRWGVVCLVWSVQARQAWLVRCDMVRTGWVFSGRLGQIWCFVFRWGWVWSNVAG